MRPRSADALPFALALALAALSLALSTGFDLDPFDSAELALAAVTAGLGHPPGQPLHTALGWLVTRGPWRPLAALAWLSIAPAAALIAVGVSRGLAGDGERDARGSSRRARLAIALAVALLASALPAVRDVATRVEVYALAAVLAVAGVLAAQRGRAFIAGVCLGLSAATNPVLAAQGGAGVLVLLATRGARAPLRARALGLARCALGALLGLSVYVYPWLVASRETRTMVWGAPRSAGEFVALLTARDFAANVAASPAGLLANLARFAWDLARTGALPLLALGAWGLFARAPRDTTARSPLAWPLVLALALGMLMVAANTPYLAANPDYGGYVLVPLGLACAGCARLAGALLAAGGATRAARAAAALLAGASLAGALPETLARGRPAGAVRALATRALADAPARAVAVLGSDHLLFPALYLQRVEGLRGDVTVLNPGWASSAWAWRWATARDRSLRVDLTPGLGGERRLYGALAARAPGRAVLAEMPGALRGLSAGGVCPAGVLWSSREGCDDATQTRIDRAVIVLRDHARRAPSRGWDGRLLRYTGRAMGDGALAIGCAGLALRYYTASVAAERPAWAPRRQCDERAPRVRPAQPATLMENTREDVLAAIARLAP